ncbi:MAG: porin [Gemmobacter sp.]|nr:porin [Gemmobacter sp.]
MKKILIATTALALTASVAAAEVKFSGDARMGLRYNSIAAQKTQLEKRMTVNIDGSTTADNGVTFGARVRIRSDENTGSAVNGARVYVRAGGLTVAAGNILGAIESMPGLYTPSVGLTGLRWSGLVTNTNARGYFGWDAYDSRGNGAEGIEAIYSAGDFTVHLSHSSNSLRGIAAPSLSQTGLYGSYNMSGWTLALGVMDATGNANDKVIASVGGKIGDYSVGLGLADNDGTMKVALSGSGTWGATTVNAYVAQEEKNAALGLSSSTSIGLGVAYNMGGGAAIAGGIERSDSGVAGSKQTRADLGVKFNF